MTESEVKAAFAAFDPQHPFYRAVLQLLESAVLAEQDNVTIPLLTDSARQFNAGRLSQAKDFRDYFSAVNQIALAEQQRQAVQAERARAT